MFSTHRFLGMSALFTFGLMLGLAEAHASMVPREWYFGRWSCLIDGRPSTMVWRVVDNPQQSCDGNSCTQSSGVRIVGQFRERTGPWVPLIRVRSSSVGLAMRYNNVDPWVLNRAGPGTAVGHTTWRGGRYPLECRQT